MVVPYASSSSFPHTLTGGDPVPLDPAPGVPCRTPPLRLVARDDRIGRAEFAAGDLVIVLDLPIHGGTETAITVQRGGRHHRDSIVLSVATARDRFVRAASTKLQVAREHLRDCIEHLVGWCSTGVLTREGILPLAEGASGPAAASSSGESDLEDVDLIHAFSNDLATLGWVGDSQAKTAVLLALVSRLTNDPLWVLLRGHRCVTAPVVQVLSGLMTDVIGQVVESARVSLGLDVPHRVLLLEDAGQVDEKALPRWRTLRYRQSVVVPTSQRSAAGRWRSEVETVRGPFGLVTCADDETALDPLAVVIPLREHPDCLIHADLHRQDQSGPDAASIHSPWLFRLSTIPRLPVVIPFADRLVFPATLARHRQDAQVFLSAIRASALLYHAHRERCGGAIVATESDFTVASIGFRGVLFAGGNVLSQTSHEILRVIAGRQAITLPELAVLLPTVPRTTLGDKLKELMDAGYLTSEPTGSGRRARIYQVHSDMACGESTTEVRLLPLNPPAVDEDPLPGQTDAVSGSVPSPSTSEPVVFEDENVRDETRTEIASTDGIDGKDGKRRNPSVFISPETEVA